MTPMTDEQEAHLQRVKDWICEKIDKKYRAGQQEHGGDLWKKAAVLDFLIDEVVDQVVYAESLEEQKNDPSIIQPGLVDNSVA
jgi:hypothetical protein